MIRRWIAQLYHFLEEQASGQVAANSCAGYVQRKNVGKGDEGA